MKVSESLRKRTRRLIIEIGKKIIFSFEKFLVKFSRVGDANFFYKGLLRYHLGLIVPEPKQACRIRVGNDFVHWEEGKSLLFDDTFHHEVWNDTEGQRAVLFMDVVRPFRFPMSFVNLLIIKLIGLSPYVQDGIKNAEKWQQGFDLAIKES
jgi:beta-hydroxylase